MSKVCVEIDADLFVLARDILPEPIEDVVEEYLKLLLHISDDETDTLNKMLNTHQEMEGLKKELFFKLKEKFKR